MRIDEQEEIESPCGSRSHPLAKSPTAILGQAPFLWCGHQGPHVFVVRPSRLHQKFDNGSRRRIAVGDLE
jgi:hypothetical protein